MTDAQAELLAALTAAGWGSLPWSGEHTSRSEPELRVELAGRYSLSARQAPAMLDITLRGGGEVMWFVRSPSAAIGAIEQWQREHAERAAEAGTAAGELRAMIAGAP